MKVTAVIPAAGVGKRFGAGLKKQFFDILGRPVLYYTLKGLNEAYDFQRFIIGASEDDFDFIKQTAEDAGVSSLTLVRGGAERSDTVYNCLSQTETKYVLIHDAVRPFVSAEIVSGVIKAASEYGAAVCAVPVSQTLKKVCGGRIFETVNRDEYILSHTPQVFSTEIVRSALNKIRETKTAVTDEAQAVELYGCCVGYTPSSGDNIKITYMEDINVVEGLVRKYFPSV